MTRRENVLLFLVAFAITLGVGTWGTYWRVKLVSHNDSLCVTDLVYCRRDYDETDALDGLPPDVLWCRCVWGGDGGEWWP
jgi:hypothetical protein